MLDTLITSKTRVKLLLKFFLNPATKAYLRSLEAEFKESSNAIRLELNRLEQAGMLNSSTQGNKKFFQVNRKHPLFNEINHIIQKHYGIDIILRSVAAKLGNLDSVYLSGNIAKGVDDGIIDLIFLGNIDKNYLVDLISKAEKLIGRKIRYVNYGFGEYDMFDGNNADHLLIWDK